MPAKSRCPVARSIFSSSLAVFLLLLGSPAEAKITQIVITKTSPVFGGTSFGSVGQYEQIDGMAFGEIDPKDSLNEIITDIKLAPRNARGMVEYQSIISILKPIDMSRGNHTLIYDVVNRGSKRITDLNIGGNATNPGDGFLESQGYTMAWIGWEGDITSGVLITLPVARNRDGSEITGRVRSEYILDSPASTQDVTAPPAYEAASTSNAGATLTRRIHQNDARELIPNDQWVFAECSVATPFPGVPSTTNVCLKGGFDTNHIYELLYTAKNPTVTGLGFAATRDFISFLRNGNGARTGRDERDDRGRRHDDDEDDDEATAPGPANPLGNAIKNVLIYGSSQSGRWIRTFIQLGFNQDENRRLVVEGAIPHKASNRGAFNIRFAQPTRLSGTQHTEAQFAGPESPQTWGESRDRIADVTAGQLDRCRKTHSCPKITATVTDTEYWQAVMSLNTTDSEGRHDLAIPPEVRIYQLSGTQHGGGNPLLQPPKVMPSVPANSQLPSNSNPFLWHQRALLVALREWVVNGTEPPPSLYSSLGRKSLVRPEEVKIPFIPAVNFTVPGLVNPKIFLDRGRQFEVEDVSGILREPAVPGSRYTVLVPQVDTDGNPIDGLRNTNVQAPLGTYTGWNIRKAGFSEGDSSDLTGAFIPFFKTKLQRLAAGDPRPSLEERYPTHADYVNAVTAAANRLLSQRLLIPDDAKSIIAAANAAAVP
jgi:alpha/beta hydrolase family protein